MQEVTTFGRWLKAQRQAMDLTQERFADRVGCTMSAIEKIERGVRRPSQQVAERIAEVLSIAPDERQAFMAWARGLQARYEPALPQSIAGIAPQQAALPVATNLPAPLTPFVGRETEVARVRSMLWRTGVRLVTLTGPPGIGKTRLGLAVAASLHQDHEHGAHFVPLDALRDPALVAATIAQTLDVEETPGATIEAALHAYLRDKRLLLLLDNFEQVAEAAPAIAEILAASPGVKVLVTSRTPVHLYGEHEFPVPPLPLPDLESTDRTALAQNPAITLFVQRAQAVQPDFELDPANAPFVAEICVRLEGLPLAIELAAARSKLFAPRLMLARLANRLDLLKGGPVDRTARQQTLEGAIAWSYDLLDEREQALFRCLGVFAGGFSVEAVEAVRAGTSNQTNTLEELERLAGKSLLLHNGAGDEPRFSMLETLREYAMKRLVESGEAAEVQQRHANYYLALAEQAESELRGPQQLAWVERLEQEHSNLRAALEWSLTPQGNLDVGLRMAAALHIFWWTRNYLSEASDWLARVLGRQEEGPTLVRTKALNAAGTIALFRGDYSQARGFYQQCLDGRRELLGRGIGDMRGIAGALGNLGLVAWNLEDYEQAYALNKESLEILRELGDKHGMARSLTGLGAIAYSQGNHAEAMTAYTEALQLFEEFGDRQSVAMMRNNLGEIALAQANLSEATAYFKDAMLLLKEIGNKAGVAGCLDGLAQVAAAAGRPEQAARLFGAADAITRATGEAVPVANRAEYTQTVAGVRDSLGERAFETAWVLGREMSLEEAVAYALTEAAPSR
ncbi:MAG: tetratricopeptide repeat protein [Chloroflexota bacterium]|nr:tetratricopeptide repeat protein [Chloroflexota bacterium]